MKVSEAIAHLEALGADQDIAITWWSKDEVIDFARDFTGLEMNVSEAEWVTALDQFADEIGIINEQMWEHVTDIIKTNKGEAQ